MGHAEIAVFCPLRRLAQSLQKLLACRRMIGRQLTGRLQMTFNLANAQQLLASIVGAVIASTIFVSAAVGPVSQFI
jgi:hypothetical protein